jgi:hypothetical protein
VKSRPWWTDPKPVQGTGQFAAMSMSVLPMQIENEINAGQ